jgi:hypothetical protein
MSRPTRPDRGFIRLRTLILLLIAAAAVVGMMTLWPVGTKYWRLKRGTVQLANKCLRPGANSDAEIDRFMNEVHRSLGFTLRRSDIWYEEFPDRVLIRVTALIPYEPPMMKKQFQEVTVEVSQKRIGAF